MTIETKYFSTIRRESSLVCYWRLNESSGIKAYDWSSKYNLSGFYDGNPVSSIPLIYNDSNAASKIFGETGQNIEIPDATPLHIVGDITIEVWVIPYKKEQTSMIMGRLNTLGVPKYTFANPYFLEIFKGAPVFSLGNGTNQKFITSPVLVPVGIPTHIVGTCFRKSMSIMINGVKVISESLGGQEVTTGENILFIGALGNNEKRFNGAMGEIALYNGGMSEKIAVEHYNIGRRILENQPYITTFDAPSYS